MHLVVSSGNNATTTRTIMGPLALMDLMGLSSLQIMTIIARTGLPDDARNTPDFPISFQQDLKLCQLMLECLPPSTELTSFVFQLSQHISITSFGIVGLAMQHAPTLRDAIQVTSRYPQLNWGHARFTIRITSTETQLQFFMLEEELTASIRGDIAQLELYCILLDLVCTRQMLMDIAGLQGRPTRIELTGKRPADWPANVTGITENIVFEAQQNALVYPRGIEQLAPTKANGLLFRFYDGIASNLAKMQTTTISFSEQVTRWLWAAKPLCSRADIARNLHLSERSLARRLQEEGVRYQDLVARVQAQRAKHLLSHSNHSITSIAEQLGYAEPASFSRAFLQWEKLTPLQWRQRYQNAH